MEIIGKENVCSNIFQFREYLVKKRYSYTTIVNTLTGIVGALNIDTTTDALPRGRRTIIRRWNEFVGSNGLQNTNLKIKYSIRVYARCIEAYYVERTVEVDATGWMGIEKNIPPILENSMTEFEKKILEYRQRQVKYRWGNDHIYIPLSVRLRKKEWENMNMKKGAKMRV